MSNSINNIIDTVISERGVTGYKTPLYTVVQDEVVAAFDHKIDELVALAAAEGYEGIAIDFLVQVGLRDEYAPEPEVTEPEDDSIEAKVSRLGEAVEHLAGLVTRLKELAESRLGARL